MTGKTEMEKALEYLINEDQDKAIECFHDYIVQRARAIHESLIAEDDLDDDIDSEEVDEAKDEDEEAVEEAKTEDKDEKVEESRFDEYFNDDDLSEEGDDEDEYSADDMETNMDVENGDMDDMEMGMNDEEYADGEMEGGESVEIPHDEAVDMMDALKDLETRFAEITGVEGSNDMDMDMDDMDMDMENGEDMEYDDMEGGDTDMEYNDDMETEESADFYEAKDEEVDEKDESEEVDEAVTHEPGVQKGHKTDAHGHHGDKDSIKHNSDARLPEAAEFDIDLTEEDFLELEEGLKEIDVKMGGEQGHVKYAGEETQLKSPVADKNKSDIPVDPKGMPSKQKEHGTYNLETVPSSYARPGESKLPHSGDNSHDSADGTGSPRRSTVSGAGGLDAQKGHGASEQGGKKFAGTETNVKSPIGSQGSRTEK